MADLKQAKRIKPFEGKEESIGVSGRRGQMRAYHPLAVGSHKIRHSITTTLRDPSDEDVQKIKLFPLIYDICVPQRSQIDWDDPITAQNVVIWLVPVS